MANYPIPVVGGYNIDSSTSFDSQDSINWWPRVDPVNNKRRMVPTSGTEVLDTFENSATTGPGRASYTVGTLEYHVVEDQVYTRDVDGNVANIGTLSSSSGYVGITSNNLQVLFVDGADGWVYTIATADFSEVTSAGFPSAPIDCVFIEGFFFVIQGLTTEFFQSAPDDAFTWDASNFAAANSEGDALVACRSLNNRLWLFSNYSISIWENQGRAGFAFRQDLNLLYNIGAYNAKSTVTNEGVMIFPARTTAGVGSIYMTSGGAPRVVSTYTIDTFLSEKSESGGLEDLEAFLFKENGQLFYQLSSTTGNFTKLYNNNDQSGNAWSSRQMIDGNRHIASSYVFFNGQGHILSYKSNDLYQMSQFIATDSGTPIYRMRKTVNFYIENYNPLKIIRIQANCENGVGITGTPNFYSPSYIQGADPKCYLSISRDGGTIFGNQHPAPLGRIGEFDRRTFWDKLGKTGKKGQLSLMFEIFDPVSTCLIDANLEYQEAAR